MHVVVLNAHSTLWSYAILQVKQAASYSVPPSQISVECVDSILENCQ